MLGEKKGSERSPADGFSCWCWACPFNIKQGGYAPSAWISRVWWESEWEAWIMNEFLIQSKMVASTPPLINAFLANQKGSKSCTNDWVLIISVTPVTRGCQKSEKVRNLRNLKQEMSELLDFWNLFSRVNPASNSLKFIKMTSKFPALPLADYGSILLHRSQLR